MEKVRNFVNELSGRLDGNHLCCCSNLSLLLSSVPSRVRNLRKMRNFWANFTDFEPEINIIKCKTEKLKQKM